MSIIHKDSFDYTFKIIIIGDTGVGKTNLILRFNDQSFKDNYVATIGVDFKTKNINIGDKKIKVQLWDTAGQQRFRTITQTYYKGASGMVLTYSVDDRRTFQNLEKWIKQIKQKTPPNIQRLIVGNKSDLTDQRQVTYQEGKNIAQKFSQSANQIQFMEVSAKTGANVQIAFMKICEKVKQNIQMNQMFSSQAKSSIMRINPVILDQNKKTCNC